MAKNTESSPISAEPRGKLPEALGQSDAFLDFQARLAAVAPVERPVLIVGERGTGKELAAARLHYLSNRWGGPFCSLNCAALSPSLIESELFGHEQGAFTGAVGKRVGRFEMADRGTLFLDELGLMPISAQEKVLRVTEYGVFERVGGSREVRADVRIVGATNSDLGKMVEGGAFKADLLDRLSFEVLHVPPLRVRKGDVTLLALHFAERMARELGFENTPEIGGRALKKLEDYDWPGNVRELKNIVERAVYQSGGAAIADIGFQPLRAPWDFSAASGKNPSGGIFDGLEEILANNGFDDAMDAFERRAMEDALSNSGTQAEAAQKLGIGYHQFRALFRKIHRK